MLLRRLYTILTTILISVVAKGNPYNGRDSIVVTERQDTLKEARITSDNLFLLDGVPMYQISHLGGIFSSFNTDVVNGLDFYKNRPQKKLDGCCASSHDCISEQEKQGQ